MAEKYLQTKESEACLRGHESKRMDDIIKDTIIVSKIREKDPGTFEKIEESLIHDGKMEKEQIAAEYEAIVKKQLQMLQADERGRQALQHEITEIRRKQEKRTEALKNRVKALEIEKERAKKIANRPPPLPRSIRLLLKEQAKKDSEYLSENISPIEEVFEEDIESSEDKENIDEEYLAEKRKMQQEWDKKAKKRFHEALKKDRQKQEHDAILKDIENAERLNRRQMAKNISEPTGKVPNYLPDKLHHAEKQVAMEDAVEKIFKNKNAKEHAVEDLEGYQDKWEAKYKQIDSVMESRMIDCVPSFVKENYSYLLQEETTLQCGKRFSGLDDSADDLNMGFIESPPADMLNNSKELDAVISQLDQMRVELNEAYEKEFKPLLEVKETPKVTSIDKSVGTDLLKLPTEDKAVEVERTPPREQVPLSSRSVQVDMLQGGVMSYKRRHLGNMYRSHANSSDRYLPESFTCQSDSSSEVRGPRSALESWSSSSYWSLPSKHGFPNVCKFCDSPGCTIPLVEDEKLHKDCIPLGKNLSKQSVDKTEKPFQASHGSTDESVKAKHSSSDDLYSDMIKSKLASYIQLVADKYLKKSATSSEALKSVEEVSSGQKSETGSKPHAAFSKSKSSDYVEVSVGTSDEDPVRTSISRQLFRSTSTEGEETGLLRNEQLGLDQLKSSEYANMNSSAEDELIKKCHEVFATNISNIFSPNDGFQVASADVSHSSDQFSSPDVTTETEQPYKKESLTGYVYHDLSTIPEMDSLLISDTKDSSLNETQQSRGKKSLPKNPDLEDISPDELDTTSASLVNAPVSEVSEIAKGIRFVRKPTPEPIEMDDTNEKPLPLISGTLPDLPTPSVKNKITIPKHQMLTPGVDNMDDTLIPLISGTLSDLQTPKHLISSIQLLPGDQISSLSSITDTQPSDGGSGSRYLRTPSPVSTLESASSTKSQPFPYASSLRDSKITQSPLVSTSDLSKYFQDISSIRHTSETSSEGTKAAPTPVQIDAKRQIKFQDSSPGTFQPMTPHSYLSTLGESSRKDYSIAKKNHLTPQNNKDIQANFKTPDSDAERFKPMTPYSYLSSGSKMTSKHPSLNAKPFSSIKGSQHVSQKNIDVINASSFKPLSLMSNVSTPKDSLMNKNFISNENDQFSDKINEEYHQYENTAGSSNFQPMAPHSYFSSGSKITPKYPSVNTKPFSPRKDNQQTSRDGVSSRNNFEESNQYSFKPLSLLSNVSTPKDTFMRQAGISSENNIQISDRANEGYHYEEASGSSFQPMTQLSHFSSPRDATASGMQELTEFSIGKELKDGSVNVRLKIPVPFDNRAASPTHEDQRASSGPKSFTYPIRLSLDVEDIVNSLKDTGNSKADGSRAQQGSRKDGLMKGNPSDKQILSGRTSPENYSDPVNTHTSNDRIALQVPSSGFVPQFSPEELTLFERNIVDGKDLFEPEMSAKNAAAGISSINPERPLYSTNNTIAFSNAKNSLKNSSSVIRNDLKILPNVASSVEQERGMSASSHGQVHKTSTSPNPILQALSQQLASSSDKLSTPCATPSNGSSTENLSEMFVESKITYQSTPAKSIEQIIEETGILEEPSLTLMNMELTVKPDSPGKSRLFSEGSLISEDFKTPSSIPSTCFTPNTLDSPSDSASNPYGCDSPSMLSFLRHEESCFVPDSIGEKKASKKTPQNEYRKRTKRLWNNLEEVRAKRLMEEKKEQIRKNLLKMKSYSKKNVTPKKN